MNASLGYSTETDDILAQARSRRGQGRLHEALAGFDRALSLQADCIQAYCGRGEVLAEMGQYDEALASYDKALELAPDHAEACNGRGYILQALRHYPEALASYDRAVSITPDFAEAQFNKSRLKLLLGDYAEGWSLYEWRWRVPKNQVYFKSFQQPLWLGDGPISGKTILLHAEQGFGDVIQFVRYAPKVEALGARVLLGAHPALIPLLQSLPCAVTLGTRVEAFPAFDLHCPLGSLPLAFKTELDSIPADIPYLAAEPPRRAQWQQRLGVRHRPRIGLAWSGSPHHANDRNRSLSLDRLAPLLGLDFEFHSLQKEIRAGDRAALAAFGVVACHEGALRDFADTAALIAELDLVIAVDTAVAHLAGALGKPVWVLLPYSPDYRWLTGRRDSPWYPTARLFRQDRVGDWAGVIEAVRAELQAPPSVAAGKCER